jgi:hypothetical protein
MSGVPYSLSVSDLLLVEGFQEAYGSGDKEKIAKILQANGMDTTQGVDEVFCAHRNLRGEVVTCVRYEGFELTTPEWLASGAASLDAHIGACKDVSKRVALQMLNPRGAISSWEDD